MAKKSGYNFKGFSVLFATKRLNNQENISENVPKKAVLKKHANTVIVYRVHKIHC